MCGVVLNTKNPANYGKDPKHISRHHLFPKRFKKYFPLETEIHETFSIESSSTIETFCYECHEEVFHNIVLNKKMIKGLSALLIGKNAKTKIKVFHQIFKQGVEAYIKKIKPNS